MTAPSLLNVSKESGQDYQLILTRYANERLLYRLAESEAVVSPETRFPEWIRIPPGARHRARCWPESGEPGRQIHP